MPITPTYSWSETPAWVTVEICLNSVSQASLDIMTTECYIKMNCSPYFFQADLYDDIDTQKSSALVDKNVIKFFLFKNNEGLWGRLTKCGDMKAILDRRQRSLDAVREQAGKAKEGAKEKISHLRRLAVSSQMKLEENVRKTIEARKEAELKEERDLLNSWQQEVSRETIQHVEETKSFPTVSEKDLATCKKEDLILGWDKVTAASKEVDNDSMSANPLQTLSEVRTRRIAPAKIATLKPGERLLPAPRRSFRVYISFTKKILPNHLPARESREKELKLLKDGAPSSDDTTDISERLPLFLQDKGDNFYCAGNFRSAINAYSDALRKDGSLVLSRANRAACYLQTGQMQACIDDCTKALQLLTEEEDGTTEESQNAILQSSSVSKLKKDFLPVDALDLLKAAPLNDSGAWKMMTQSCILARRASARSHLEDLEEAVADFKEALKLNPLSTDVRRVLDCIAAK